MIKEQLVPTLETCEHLSRVGFPQDTHFRWITIDYSDDWLTCKKPGWSNPTFAAPTLDEILQVLFKQLTGYPELRVLAKTLILFPDEGQQSHTLIGSNRAEVAALLYIQLHTLSNERYPTNLHPDADKQVAS